MSKYNSNCYRVNAGYMLKSSQGLCDPQSHLYSEQKTGGSETISLKQRKAILWTLSFSNFYNENFSVLLLRRVQLVIDMISDL